VAELKAVAQARAQALEMHVDVVAVEDDVDGWPVLQLERLHPDARGSELLPKTNLDIARATLRVEQGPFVRLRFEAATRGLPFRTLVVTGEGGAWTAEGSDFANGFLGRVGATLKLLARHAYQLVFEGDRLVAEVTLARRSVREAVASLLVIWRQARPNRGRGTSSRTRAKRKRRARGRGAQVTRDAVLELTAWMTQATSAYGGQVERVRDTLEARVTLAGHLSDELGGRLVAGFSTLRSRIHEVGLRATLAIPATTHQVSLSPQRGVRGLFASFTDDKVGDAEIDRAYVIRLGGATPELVHALKAPLLACARRRASLHLTHDRLVVHLEEVRVDESALHEDVGAALSLWREAARWAAGLSA
jgi:hypothetical protein